MMPKKEFIKYFNESSRKGQFSSAALGHIYAYVSQGWGYELTDIIAICVHFCELTGKERRDFEASAYEIPIVSRQRYLLVYQKG